MTLIRGGFLRLLSALPSVASVFSKRGLVFFYLRHRAMWTLNGQGVIDCLFRPWYFCSKFPMCSRYCFKEIVPRLEVKVSNNRHSFRAHSIYSLRFKLGCEAKFVASWKTALYKTLVCWDKSFCVVNYVVSATNNVMLHETIGRIILVYYWFVTPVATYSSIDS